MSSENYREFSSSQGRGKFPTSIPVQRNPNSSGPGYMNTNYRMAENGPDSTTPKQSRSKTLTSSVYEVNYEISV